MTSHRVLYFCLFVLLFNLACKKHTHDRQISGHTILLDTLNVPQKDALQDSIIERYRSSLEEDMNRVLVYSEHIMEKGTPEGRLNNFVADLVLEVGEEIYQAQDGGSIDFCLLNYGGLRVPLPKGEITYSRVYELLPFENEMVVITLSGQKTFELFQYLAESSAGMPISGVKLIISNNYPQTIVIKGQEFDITKTYKVLTSDYLAGGGDSMNFFFQPINYELLGMRVRDAIIHFMKEKHAEGETIQADLDQRIEVVNQ